MSSEEKAKGLEEELSAFGIKAKGFKSDASKFEAAQDLADQVMETFGSIDVLVNNAGITKDNLLMRMSEEDFDTVMEVNMKSIFNLTKAILRPMLKQRSGSIINMSSVVGVKGNAGQANYTASKAGIIGMSKSIALELAKRNVTVNCISPGFIESNMTDLLTDNQKEIILKKIPLEIIGSPYDVAHCVNFIASDESRYITGETIHVNGGLAML